MFRVTFSDAGKLQRFLNTCELDYVDLLLNDYGCCLVSNSSEAFSYLSVKSERSAGQEDVKFRLKTKLVSSIEDGDCVEFEYSDENITSVFYNQQGSVKFHCSFRPQVVAESTYADKLEIVNEFGNVPMLDGEELDVMCKIAKLNGGLITVDRGAASVIMQNGSRVYRKVKTTQSFSFTYRAFDKLRKCGSGFCNYREFLIAVDDGFYVLVRKARLGSNDEFELISGDTFGSKLIAEVNLGNLFHFLYRTKAKPDSIILSTELAECTIKAFDFEFKVPIEIKGKKTTTTEEPIVLPLAVVNLVLNQLRTSKFTLKVKKNFLQFETPDFVVVL